MPGLQHAGPGYSGGDCDPCDRHGELNMIFWLTENRKIFYLDPDFLVRTNLIHEHSHRHKQLVHRHQHVHEHHH